MKTGEPRPGGQLRARLASAQRSDDSLVGVAYGALPVKVA